MSGSGAPKQLCGKRHWRGERCPEGICPPSAIPETVNQGKRPTSKDKSKAANTHKADKESKTQREKAVSSAKAHTPDTEQGSKPQHDARDNRESHGTGQCVSGEKPDSAPSINTDKASINGHEASINTNGPSINATGRAARARRWQEKHREGYNAYMAAYMREYRARRRQGVKQTGVGTENN